MWICENCKEENEDNFDTCWKCFDATSLEKEVKERVEAESNIIKEHLEKDGDKHYDEFIKDSKNHIAEAFKYAIGITIASIMATFIGC